MTKTFYITYWASKHKKHITRKGSMTKNLVMVFPKNNVPYYVYYDLDAHGYRTATTTWKSEALMTSFEFYVVCFSWLI